MGEFPDTMRPPSWYWFAVCAFFLLGPLALLLTLLWVAGANPWR